MPERMKQGRLPFGLPRLTRPRSGSVYAAFRRPSSARPSKPDATFDETAGVKEVRNGVVLLRK